ncbi:MerR family transcriptional regulator [Planococcus sp. X10-3]|uniref:MerR family transcriptional regulator n=1 Tax=Planococcus sp. X10-3 TaxID=3061240 RepID=UPI003BAF1884
MYTSEIAKNVGVHPNTVRLYEEWHYISPVPRQPNGYRIYSEIHVLQMTIARLAFKQEFIQNNLRKKATKIVRLSGQEAFFDSLRAAESYLLFLQSEYHYTVKSIETVDLLLQNQPFSANVYSHQEAAAHLQLTQETLRNWERNDLYAVRRTSQNRRIYAESDIQKLLIIRTLRTAHLSITSIAHLFRELELPLGKDVFAIISSAKFTEDFSHVTDDLLNNLKIAMKDVESIIAILKKLQ